MPAPSLHIAFPFTSAGAPRPAKRPAPMMRHATVKESGVKESGVKESGVKGSGAKGSGPRAAARGGGIRPASNG